MPRPRDAKVWNSDLTRAMQTRHFDAVATRSSRSFMWQRAAAAVERMSGEIYAFSTGRIVGLPKVGTDFTDTAKQTCERIIRGIAAIVPDGMEASDPAAAGFEPPVIRAQDHPYLNKMQRRGGGFALLCAFHFHPSSRGCHYKSELIRNAQPYCDDAMEPNYFAGRTTTAGWKSIESLERHKLVYRKSMSGARHAAGYNRGPQDEFALTPDGVSFIQAMLQKWPTAPARGASGTGTPSSARVTGPRSASAPSTASKKSQQDEQQLRTWLTAGPACGEEMRFKVSNARRLHLHRVCSALEQQGYLLRHLSKGSSEPKTLVITVERCPARSKVGSSSVKRARSLASMDDSTGHRLGRDGRRDRAATIATPQMAAAEAAEKRRRLTSGGVTDSSASSHVAAVRPRAGLAAHGQGSARAALQFVDEEEGLQCAIDRSLQDIANANDGQAASRPQTNEDGWEVEYGATSKSELDACMESASATAARSASSRLGSTSPSSALMATKTAPISAAAAAAAGSAKGMRMLVDSRERVTNARPRQILDCASRHLQTAKQNNGNLAELAECEVQRESLSLGDYGWLLRDGRVASTVVERKRIGDLVGRSAAASGVAHLEQISRLRELEQWRTDQKVPARCFLLLEGDLRQANTQVVWDQTEDDEGSTVDSLEAIYEMIANIFVENGRAVQILHSNDEEGTCRLLAQLSVVVATTQTPLAQNYTLADYNTMHKKAEVFQRRDEFVKELAASADEQAELEPRQLAKTVSSRWNSWGALANDFRLCSTKQLRYSLLVPICPRGRERWSSVVASIDAARHQRTDTTNTAARLLSRQIDVVGTDSVIGRMRNIGSEAERIRFQLPSQAAGFANVDHDSVFGWASLQTFGTARNGIGARISCSRIFRLVHITGEQLVNYLESSYLDDNCSDYDVADRAAKMLMHDLDAMPRASENAEEMTELVLFEGVLRQCKRHTRGSHTATGTQFDSRVRMLCELTIVLLQHRGDKRSFISINAPSGGGVVGGSVIDCLLRALVSSVRDHALLYFSPPSADGCPPSQVRCATPTAAAASVPTGSASHSEPRQISPSSGLREICDLVDSSEDEDELMSLWPTWNARLQQPGSNNTTATATRVTSHVAAETIDLVGDG